MKALHLCAGNLYGGVERIVAECAASRALVPGMQPHFAVCFDGRLARELDAMGARPTRLGAVRVSRPHTLMRARRALAELLSVEQPDAVVCHSAWMLGLAAPGVARHSARLAVWLHDGVSGRTWVERWAARSTPDVVICNSRFTADSAPTMFPNQPPQVVYAPVAKHAADPSSRERLRSELGALPGDCVILIAGRFEPWKGHAALVDSLSAIRGTWRLWIAGDAQKPTDAAVLAALRQQCIAREVTHRVSFLGHRDDVPDLMAAADLYCQPNTGPEPFGLVFVEALYAGLPVITSAMGGALEILDDTCGVLVPVGEGAALPAALNRLIADPPARRRLAANGPARAARLCDPARQLSVLAGVLSAAAVSTS